MAANATQATPATNWQVAVFFFVQGKYSFNMKDDDLIRSIQTFTFKAENSNTSGVLTASSTRPQADGLKNAFETDT